MKLKLVFLNTVKVPVNQYLVLPSIDDSMYQRKHLIVERDSSSLMLSVLVPSAFTWRR